MPRQPARSAKTASTTTPKPSEAPAPLEERQASFSDRFGPARTASPDIPEPMPTVKPTAPADPQLAQAWKNKSGRELTEAELLAMPESEYMNDKQLDFFRMKLQGQKDDLLSNAGETTEHLREDTTIVPDPADRATIEEEHALELRTRDRERKLLKKISQALTRLDTGDYGYCDETGEPIGLPRLLARPTATLSLEAQQRRELKQKMFGD
jgi:DnaK suppressor protein